LKDAGVQVSYGSARFGTFTATATRSEFEDGSRQNSYTLRYNISPSVHWNIATTFGHISGQAGAASGVAAALSVSYFFDDRTNATARVQRTPGNGTEYDVEVARPAPQGPFATRPVRAGHQVQRPGRRQGLPDAQEERRGQE
jgi:hypothetical protein